MSGRHHPDKAFHALRQVSGYFTLLLIVLLAMVTGVLALVAAVVPPHDWQSAWPLIGAAVAMVLTGILMQAWWTARQLRRHGGAWVAQWAHGRLIDEPSSPIEGRLLLITQGLARYLNMPRPDVYVLEREDAINAFMAGWSARDAALAVTRGALDTLSASELQALIAHEFGHMPTDDMRLNMVLLPRVLAFSWVYGWGRSLMQSPANGTRPHLLRWAAGSVLLTLGWPGWVAAKLLQAVACDRHEYQADASAVRATLDRRALGNTLRKIWYQNEYTDVRLRHPQADALATMLFHHPQSWRIFNTHPELQDRIRRVLGRDRAPIPARQAEPGSATEAVRPPRASKSTPASAPAQRPEVPTPPSVDFERTVVTIRAASPPPPAVIDPIEHAAPEPTAEPVAPPNPEPRAVLAPASAQAPAPQTAHQQAIHHATHHALSASDTPSTLAAMTAEEAEALHRLLHLDSDAMRRAAILAFMRVPGGQGKANTWGVETQGIPASERILLDVQGLSHANRLPVFEALLNRSATTAMVERRQLLESARRMMAGDGRVWHLDVLRYLAMVQLLNQKRSGPLAQAASEVEPALGALHHQEWLTVAAFCTLLAHLIPTASHTGEISAPGEDWYYASMVRAAGDQRASTLLPPDVHDPALSPWGLQDITSDQGASELTHATVALLGMRALPAATRAALLQIWAEEALARSHAWQLSEDSADALRLTALLIDAALPVAVASRYRD